MELLVTFALFGFGIISLILCISVFIREDQKLHHNMLFEGLCLGCAIWDIGVALLTISPNNASEFRIATRAVFCIGIFLCVNFGLLIAEDWSNVSKKTRNFTKAIMLGPSIILYLIMADSENVEFIKTRYGWSYRVKWNLGRIFFDVAIAILVVTMICIAIYGIRKMKKKREKVLAITAAGCVLVMVLGMITDMIAPIMGVPVFPGSAAAMFAVVMIVYTISVRLNISSITIQNISDHLFTAIDVPIIVLDEEGKVVISNFSAGRFMGIGTSGMLGRRLEDFFACENILPLHSNNYSDTIALKTEVECKYNNAKCELCINKLMDIYDEPLGDIVAVTNMTDKIRMIEQLEESRKAAIEANEAKSVFLANMSHEIRTPMNVVVGMSEIILHQEVPRNIATNLTEIHNAGVNLLGLLNNILDLSGMEADNFKINSVEYSLTTVIADVVSMASVKISEKPVKLLVQIQSDLPEKIYGDDIKVLQILTNLVGNAVKYTKRGFIKIEVLGGFPENTKDAIGTLAFCITDTGIGIEEEDIPKIFEEFHQVDTRKNRSTVGTGLGLALSRRIARKMGGDIIVKSIYGKGSSFFATIEQKKCGNQKVAELKKTLSGDIVLWKISSLVSENCNQCLKKLGITPITIKKDDTGSILEPSGVSYIIMERLEFEKKPEEYARIWGKDKLVLLLSQDETYNVKWEEYKQLNETLFTFQVAKLINQDRIIRAEKKGRFTNELVIEMPFARALVVDDNATNRQVAMGLMAPYNMQIDVVASGKEAIDYIKKNKYDIIFMDHMMPEMDGVDTVHVIRQLEGDYFHTVPIVALTANVIYGVKEMFLENGFDEFLAKPIDFSELNRVMREYVLPKESHYTKLVGKDFSEDFVSTEEFKSKEQMQISEKLCDWIHISLEQVENLFGNNLEMYERILHTFQADLQERKQEIISLLQKKDMKNMNICFHALKSASRSIGAIKLSQISEVLEYMALSENIEDINNKLPELQLEMNAVAVEVEQLLQDNEKNDNAKKQMLIMVVDDDRTNLHYIKELLGSEHKLLLINSGEKAIKALTKAIPDLIFMDLLMPEMDGIETMRRIRENPDYDKIPVVFLTASDEAARAKCLEAGAIGCVQKPVSVIDLTSFINKVS